MFTFIVIRTILRFTPVISVEYGYMTTPVGSQQESITKTGPLKLIPTSASKGKTNKQSKHLL